MLMTGSQRIRRGNGRSLCIASDRSMFKTNMTPRRNIGADIGVDVDWGVLVRITYNGSVEQVLEGVVFTGRLVGGVILVVWNRR